MVKPSLIMLLSKMLRITILLNEQSIAVNTDFVPRRTSYGVYISQFIRFARASSNLNDFNYRNKALTAKLLRQGYRYFKLCKAFPKFYRRHSALVEEYSVSLKTLLNKVYQN